MARSIGPSLTVTSRIGVPGAGARAFGQTMMLTTSTEIPFSAIASYANIDDVAQDFPVTSSVYRAARVFFGQTRWFPKPLLVGRWLQDAAGSVMTGSAPDVATLQSFESTNSVYTADAPGTISAIKAVGTPALTWEGATMTGLDFSSDTTFADIAGTLQAAMRASSVTKLDDALVTYENGAFRVEIARSAGVFTGTAGTGNLAALTGFDGTTHTDGTNVTLTLEGATANDLSFTGDSLATIALELQAALRGSGVTKLANVVVEYHAGTNAFVLSLPSGAGDFTAVASGDAAAALGLDDATFVTGSAAETISECLDRLQDLEGNFYAIVPEYAIGTVEANAFALSDWVQTRKYVTFIDVTGNDALVGQEQQSLAWELFDRASDRTALVWSGSQDYKSMGFASRFSAVTWSRPGSLPDAKWLQFDVVGADDLTTSQKAELDRKRINTYSRTNLGPITAEGVMTHAERWMDTRIWVDWQEAEILRELWDLFRNSNRVPLTLTGTARIVNAVTVALRRGVVNGGIGVGLSLPEPTAASVRTVTGNEAFDGVLTQGFLVHVGALSERTAADRANRRSPPITVWVTGSGAIHGLNLQLNITEG